LKIPKKYSEAVNGRKTDNTMPKRKTKVHAMIYRTLHRKPIIEQH